MLFSGTPAAIVNPKDEILRISRAAMMHTDSKNSSFEAMLHPSGDSGNQNHGVKRKLEDSTPMTQKEEDDQAHDEVRLWEDGFKDRYYESKFDVMPDNMQFRYSVALQYVKGLCWVLQYYYQGCASWEWWVLIQRRYFIFQYLNMSKISDFSSARHTKNLIFLKKI